MHFHALMPSTLITFVHHRARDVEECLKINENIKIECNSYIKTWEANINVEMSVGWSIKMDINNSCSWSMHDSSCDYCILPHPNESQRKMYGLVLKLLRAIL